jgi:hypothetical protein
MIVFDCNEMDDCRYQDKIGYERGRAPGCVKVRVGSDDSGNCVGGLIAYISWQDI